MFLYWKKDKTSQTWRSVGNARLNDPKRFQIIQMCLRRQMADGN